VGVLGYLLMNGPIGAGVTKKTTVQTFLLIFKCHQRLYCVEGRTRMRLTVVLSFESLSPLIMLEDAPHPGFWWIIVSRCRGAMKGEAFLG
jgi:hypothetical protein